MESLSHRPATASEVANIIFNIIRVLKTKERVIRRRDTRVGRETLEKIAYHSTVEEKKGGKGMKNRKKKRKNRQIMGKGSRKNKEVCCR